MDGATPKDSQWFFIDFHLFSNDLIGFLLILIDFGLAAARQPGKRADATLHLAICGPQPGDLAESAFHLAGLKWSLC